MKTKQCSKCKEAKPVEGFGKDKANKDGLNKQCKECRKQYREANKEALAEKAKQYYEANKEAIAKKKKQSYEDNKDAIFNRKKQYREANKEALAEKAKQYYEANKEAIAKRKKQSYEANKEAILKSQKKYREANKEAIADHKKQYRDANKEVIAERNKQYQKKRRAEDPVFCMVHNLRSRMHQALNGKCKADTTKALLGCTYEEARAHIEAQFTEGMSWDKMGRHGIHIDHIRPCASFDLSDPEQQRECFHYTNLQPLWAEDNLKKSDKW